MEDIYANKKDLCGKHVPLKTRIKFFDSTVTPTVLYGCAAWSMTADRERLLRSAQRRMLRKMLGSGRQMVKELDASSESEAGQDSEDCTEVADQGFLREETWIEWLQRTTCIVEEQLRGTGLDDWVSTQRKRKWVFAGHVARRTDSRWSRKFLCWQPVGGFRLRGHPTRRWRDVFDEFLKLVGLDASCLVHLAQDRHSWANLGKDFVQFSC